LRLGKSIENELTPREAVNAMLNGERLVDFEREKIRVRGMLGFDLDLSGLPQIRTRYSLSGAMFQAISMCRAQKWEINETHVYSVLANLDSDLESMFPSYDYENDNPSKNKRSKKEMKTKKTSTPKTKAKKTTKKATSRAKTPTKTKAAMKGKQRPK